MVQNFAAIIVRPHIEGKQEQITKNVYALFVEGSFVSTNMQKQKRAPKNAQLHYVGIKSITPIGKQPVYNMEVSKFHNFAVNGGIIVHNCMDDIRYFAMTILRHKAGKEQYIPLYARR